LTMTFDLQLNRKLHKGRGSPFWRRQLCQRDYSAGSLIIHAGISGYLSINLRVFRAFSSVVRQMPGYNSQRRGTTRTSQFFPCNCFIFFL
jgi:hypothetical protein